MIDSTDRLNNQVLSPYGTLQSVFPPRVVHRRTRLGCPKKQLLFFPIKNLEPWTCQPF